MIRSALMVAGDKLKHLQKIPSLECDIAIVNLGLMKDLGA